MLQSKACILSQSAEYPGGNLQGHILCCNRQTGLCHHELQDKGVISPTCQAVCGA